MKFLCLVCLEEGALESLSKEENQALIDKSMENDEVLMKKGHFLAASALAPAATAKTLRRKNGAITVTDGPFTESKEQVGGFILIEAQDMNQAVELAATLPPLCLGAVEVRPLREITHSRTIPVL